MCYDLSLYSALLVRMQLAKSQSCSPNFLNFSTNQFGKPVSLTFPKIKFSLSHSHKKILLCTSTSQEIGCDIEFIQNNLQSMMPLDLFHSDECKFIFAENNEKIINKRFFETWTKKEAYFKRIGTGLTPETEHISTLSLPNSIFYSWEEDGYRCSINCENPEKTTKHYMEEEDVISFFKI
ncbi:4'-phosphopantetheinyl transferase superfamily protein [Streptococcus sp. DD11]|uniref:4'-phosphopantetheinyl transferase family protein n=1 Tax=Streptococcus sp. DD11 TaxID=1777879 RepID=UPI000A9F9925|nr:4'-phosphopantetheinyl transferase superfamily protein [Streptococcus sp. DD11]